MNLIITESEKKQILSLYYKNELRGDQFKKSTSKLLYEQMTVYYYDANGKFGENLQNKLPNGAVDAKYIYPDAPYQKNSFPPNIEPNYVNIGLEKQRTENEWLSQQSYDNNAGNRFSQSLETAKLVTDGCSKNPKSDYVMFKQGGYQYLCHTNYCNNHKEQRYDPERKLCEDNTNLAKIKEMGLDGFMDLFREEMNSVAGVAVQVILDATGVGGLLVEVAWGLLLGWDFYQGSQGNWDFINILIDLFGVATFGPGAKMMSTFLKGAKYTGKTYEAFLEWFKTQPKLLKTVKSLNFEAVVKNVISGLRKLALKIKMFEPLVVKVEKAFQWATGLKAAASTTLKEIEQNLAQKTVAKTGEHVASEKAGELIDYGANNITQKLNQDNVGSTVVNTVNAASKLATVGNH